MIPFLIVVVILIGIASLIGTLYAGRQVNETIKAVDEADPNLHDDLLKTNYYKNAKSNFSLMIFIYVLLFIVFIAMGIGAYLIFVK